MNNIKIIVLVLFLNSQLCEPVPASLFNFFAPDNVKDLTNILTPDKVEELEQLLTYEKLQMYNNITSEETIKTAKKEFINYMNSFVILFYANLTFIGFCVIVLSSGIVISGIKKIRRRARVNKSKFSVVGQKHHKSPSVNKYLLINTDSILSQSSK